MKPRRERSKKRMRVMNLCELEATWPKRSRTPFHQSAHSATLADVLNVRNKIDKAGS